MNSLTAEAVTDGAADYVAVYDASASAMRKVLLDNLPSASGGGTVLPEVCGGRLTLSSSDAVTTADTDSTTLYFLPYTGRQVALYSGTSWSYFDMGASGVSITTSGLSADTNYDVWGYDSSGSVALELLAWSSDTARASAITRQDGVWSKSGATTRRLLGTVRVVEKAADHTSPGMTVGGSLTYSGAGGNAALIDDNSGTSAADPSGYNTGTSWSVDLGAGNAQTVNKITVTKDTTNGLGNAATMKLEYSDNNSTWTQAGGNFTISSGTSGTAESFTFSYDNSAHRYWRIYYVSGTTGGNFWLQEITLGDNTLTFRDAVRERFVANAQSAVAYADTSLDTTASWSDAGAGTWSAINGGGAAWKHSFLTSIPGEAVSCEVLVFADSEYTVGVALDSSTALHASSTAGLVGGSASGLSGTSVAKATEQPSVGLHYFQGIETTVTGAISAYGSPTANSGQSGMTMHGWR